MSNEKTVAMGHVRGRSFTDKGLSHDESCPVCGARTRALHTASTRLGEHTSWEHESTLKLLGVDAVKSQMRFCPSCFHFYHFPLFEESRIYGKEGGACRKEYYEKKYLPGQVYGGQNRYSGQWYAKNREVFLYISTIFKQIAREFPGNKTKESVSMLDWGGGDGYLVETLSLISKKVFNLPCKAYCFDYHEWAADSQSPYFQYVTKKGLEEKAPFDIIFICHVLEHVAFPADLLSECRKYLSPDGIVVAYVPFQQYRALSRGSSLLDYHQQLFSTNSMAEALRRSGFTNISSNLYRLSYRGNEGYHVLATASAAGRPARPSPLHHLFDSYNFFKVLLDAVMRKVRERISKRIT